MPLGAPLPPPVAVLPALPEMPAFARPPPPVPAGPAPALPPSLASLPLAPSLTSPRNPVRLHAATTSASEAPSIRNQRHRFTAPSLSYLATAGKGPLVTPRERRAARTLLAVLAVSTGTGASPGSPRAHDPPRGAPH